MDPNATLDRMLYLAAVIQDQSTPEEVEGAATELARSVQDLNGWLARGGFLPAAWTEGRR